MFPGLAFDASDHTYRLDGTIVPSVTEILREMGAIDFSHVPPFALDEARTRGLTVHRAIHFLNEDDLDLAHFTHAHPQYCGYLQGWQRFREERRFVPVLNEYRVISRRHRVAGTLDCLGLLDGRAILLDFKTGRPQDVAADLQTAAYFGLAMESAEEDPTLKAFFAEHLMVRRFAVQLRKDATFHLEPYCQPTDYREFLALATAYHVVAKHRPRVVRELSEVA